MHDYLKNDFTVEAARMEQDTMLFYMNPAGESRGRLLSTAFQNVVDWITQKYNISVTVALLDEAVPKEQCGRMYKRLLDMLQYRFIFGNNQIITEESVTDKMVSPVNFPYMLINNIVTSMKKGNERLFEEQIESFIEIVSNYTWQTAQLAYRKLQIECIYLMQNEIKDAVLDDHVSIEKTADTLVQAKEDFINYFREFQQFKQSRESSPKKTTQILLDSVEYIKTVYNQNNLSVETIASKYGYSANYYSKLFLSVMHMHVTAYIKQLRIAEAQKLLIQGEMPISEIAEKVGFTNDNYFYSVFKKETGLTPAQFRESKQNVDPFEQ